MILCSFIHDIFDHWWWYAEPQCICRNESNRCDICISYFCDKIFYIVEHGNSISLDRYVTSDPLASSHYIWQQTLRSNLILYRFKIYASWAWGLPRYSYETEVCKLNTLVQIFVYQKRIFVLIVDELPLYLHGLQVIRFWKFVHISLYLFISTVSRSLFWEH